MAREIDLEELDFPMVKIPSKDLLAITAGMYTNDNSSLTSSLDTAMGFGPPSEGEESEDAMAAANAFDAVVLESAVSSLKDRVSLSVGTDASASMPMGLPQSQPAPPSNAPDALYGMESGPAAAPVSETASEASCESGAAAPSDAPSDGGMNHAASLFAAQQNAAARAARLAYGGSLSLSPSPSGLLGFPNGALASLDLLGSQRLLSDPLMFQSLMHSFAGGNNLASRRVAAGEHGLAPAQYPYPASVAPARQAMPTHPATSLSQGMSVSQGLPAGLNGLSPSGVNVSPHPAGPVTVASTPSSSHARAPRAQGAHNAAAAAASAASQLMHAEAEACSLARGGACKPGAINRKPWSRQEDNAIRALVAKLGQRWRVIAPHLAGRSDDSVRNRWKRISEEDGEGSPVEPAFSGRSEARTTPKPPSHTSSAASNQGDSARASWSRAEDQVIVRAVQELGPRWSAVAARLPTRTEQAVRNRWNRLQQRARVGARQAAMSAQRQAMAL